MGRQHGSCAECSASRLLVARRLCTACYQRLAYHGQLDRHPASNKPPEQWFAEIDRSDPSACWIWPGARNRFGYGKAGIRGRGAHVYIYEMFVGPIPEGQTVGHKCHDRCPVCPGGNVCLHRACVNYVEHLKLESLRDNLLSSPHTIPSINSRKTHCSAGHPFSGANLAFYGNRRRCRACARDKQRRRMTRLAAALSPPRGSGPDA